MEGLEVTFCSTKSHLVAASATARRSNAFHDVMKAFEEQVADHRTTLHEATERIHATQYALLFGCLTEVSPRGPNSWIRLRKSMKKWRKWISSKTLTTTLWYEPEVALTTGEMLPINRNV